MTKETFLFIEGYKNLLEKLTFGYNSSNLSLFSLIYESEFMLFFRLTEGWISGRKGSSVRKYIDKRDRIEGVPIDRSRDKANGNRRVFIVF